MQHKKTHYVARKPTHKKTQKQRKNENLNFQKYANLYEKGCNCRTFLEKIYKKNAKTRIT